MSTKMIFLAIDLNDLHEIYEILAHLEAEDISTPEVIGIIQQFHAEKYDADMSEHDASRYAKSLKNFYFAE